MTATANAAIYNQGVVYVIYDEAGANAVTDKTDKNSNGVPDVIEDIATQINAAREVFIAFNYPDPLNCERFKNVASIEVYIEAAETLKLNGMASATVRKKSVHNPDERALQLKIANVTNPRTNSTPTHEYFHLVQYSATYFRNAWFLEGMARWSQDAADKINYPSALDLNFKLKSNFAEKKIFRGKYDMAEFLWYPLAVSKKDKAKISAALIKKYKYVDGSPVFHDNIFCGAHVMLKVLNALKTKEELAAAQFGGIETWRKSGQRADSNNKIILDCVKGVCYDKF